MSTHSKKGIFFLIAVLLSFFLSGSVFAGYSNDTPVPTITTPPPTVISPPKTPPSPPPPAPPPRTPKEPEQPRIKVNVPRIPDAYEITPTSLTGADVIVKVLEAGAKKAISGAVVKWYGINYTTGGVTDNRGEAKIGRVPPDEAKITVSAEGYDSNSKVVRVKSSIKTQYFDIYLNKTAGIVRSSEMPPTVTTAPPVDTEKKVSISGIVYDKVVKKPISGASVKLTGTGPGQNVINKKSSDGSKRNKIPGRPSGVTVKLIY